MKNTRKRGARAILAAYWSSYGGFGALVRSFYFFVAVVLSLLCAAVWTQPGWWDDVTAVLPNLLGFSLGGYAMLLAFGDEKFRADLAGGMELERSRPAAETHPVPGDVQSRKPIQDQTVPDVFSPFIIVNSTFAHFIVVQALALIYAMMAKSWNFDVMILFSMLRIEDSTPAYVIALVIRFVRPFMWWIGYMLFMYALVLTIAATMAVFRIATWYDSYQSYKRAKDKLRDTDE